MTLMTWRTFGGTQTHQMTRLLCTWSRKVSSQLQGLSVSVIGGGVTLLLTLMEQLHMSTTFPYTTGSTCQL